jgi:hypothetical protein
MLISAIGLLAGVALPLPPMLPFAFGILPLIWYHLFYLRPKAGDGISQPAVDSVYYFGFLITIGALGATALRLGLYGVEGSFANVAMQFGLGLLATGYAVWARIHLTASSALLDEANLEEAMNRYVERSRVLVSNVELASSNFQQYAETILASSEAFAKRVHDDTNAEIRHAAETFRSAISGLSEEGKIALHSLRAVVNDVTFGSEREELRKSVTAMTVTVTKLTKTLEELRTSSTAGASSVEQFAGGLAAVGSRANEAAQRLGELGDHEGILPKVLAALEESRRMFDELNLSVDVAGVSVTKFSDNVTASASIAADFKSQAGIAVQSMRDIDKVTKKVTALLESLASLEQQFNDLTATTGLSDSSLLGMTTKVDELKSVLENLNFALIDSTGGLKDSMQSISDELEGRLQRSIESMDLYARRVSEDPPLVQTQGVA